MVSKEKGGWAKFAGLLRPEKDGEGVGKERTAIIIRGGTRWRGASSGELFYTLRP